MLADWRKHSYCGVKVAPMHCGSRTFGHQLWRIACCQVREADVFKVLHAGNRAACDCRKWRLACTWFCDSIIAGNRGDATDSVFDVPVFLLRGAQIRYVVFDFNRLLDLYCGFLFISEWPFRLSCHEWYSRWASPSSSAPWSISIGSWRRKAGWGQCHQWALWQGAGSETRERQRAITRTTTPTLIGRRCAQNSSSPHFEPSCGIEGWVRDFESHTCVG